MTYKYSLFIDDERYPTDDRNWFVARSSGEACRMIEKLGMPEHISFDHDLGGDDNALAFVKWLVERALDKGEDLDFSYVIHSQNPVGSENIRGLIVGYRASRSERRNEDLSDGEPEA